MCVCNFYYFWINVMYISILYIVIKHNKTELKTTDTDEFFRNLGVPGGHRSPQPLSGPHQMSILVGKSTVGYPKIDDFVDGKSMKIHKSLKYGWFGITPYFRTPPYSMGYSAGIFSEVCHGKYTVSNLRYNQPLDVIVRCIRNGNWPSSSVHLK